MLALHTKNNVRDTLHFTEALCVLVVGHFDMFVLSPSDLDDETGGRELNEPQRKVTTVGIVIVRLQVADAAAIVLELPLNEKIGMGRRRQVKTIFVFPGSLVVERDLEVFTAGLINRCPAPCKGL